MATINKFASLFIAFSLFLFLIDVVLLGSGSWSINIVGLSLRKVEYAILLGMVLITINNSRAYVYLCAIVVFCAVFGVIVPLLNDVKLEYATTELLSLFGIMLCPLIVQNNYISTNWLKIRRLLLILCIISAFFHIAIWLIGLSGSASINSVKFFLMKVLTAGDAGAIDNIIIADTPDGLFRVLLPSSSLLVIGFYLSLQKLLHDRRLRDYVMVFVMALALFSTWTRALYLSPILIVLGLFFYKLCPLSLKLGVFGTFSLITFLIVLFVLVSGAMVHPDVLVLLGIASDTSDGVRFEQVAWILDTFLSHPIFGTGLGGSATHVRSVIAPWTYEMSLLALIMKIGIVGCVSFIIISAAQIPYFFANFFNGRRLPAQKVVWLLFSLSILIMFSTNPFMLSFPGVTLTFFILGELNYLKNEYNNEYIS